MLFRYGWIGCLVSLVSLGCADEATMTMVDPIMGTDGGMGVTDAGTSDPSSNPPQMMTGGGDDRCPPPPEGGVRPFDCTTETPSIEFGEPVALDEPGNWTWIDVPGSYCMNGSTAGFAVNPSTSPTADRLMIFLEGGGACFDLYSCLGAAGQNSSGSELFAGMRDYLRSGVFARGDSGNPVRDYHYVYVPYCSGDAHAGTAMSGTGGRVQRGYSNMTEYLKRIVPTFRDNVSEVLLAGRSAGGLGTMINYPQVQESFGCTPVNLLNDSGPVMGDDYMRSCIQQRVRDVWNIDAAIPADCPHCTCEDGGGLINVFSYFTERYPERRVALIASMADATFRSFFGYGYSPSCDFPVNMPASEYRAGLEELRALTADNANFRSFYLEGEEHTFIGGYLGGTTTGGGTTLSDWLTSFIANDDRHLHVGP